MVAGGQHTFMQGKSELNIKTKSQKHKQLEYVEQHTTVTVASCVNKIVSNALLGVQGAGDALYTET